MTRVTVALAVPPNVRVRRPSPPQVPRAFWNSFFDQRGLTFDAAHRHLVRNYEFAQTGTSPLGRTKFTECIQGFLGLVDTDPKAGMECSICKHLHDSAKTFVVDGLEQGFPMRSMKPPPAYVREGDVRNILITEYMLVPHLTARRHLTKYLRETTPDFAELRASMDRHAPWLVDFLDHARANETPAERNRCPKPLRRFMECVSRNSPVNAYVHHEATRRKGLMWQWTEHAGPLAPDMLSGIARTFPALADMLAVNGWTEIPACLVPAMVSAYWTHWTHWTHLTHAFRRAPVDATMCLNVRAQREMMRRAQLADTAPVLVAPVHPVQDSDWVCAPSFRANNTLANYGADRAAIRAANKAEDKCTKMTRSSAALTNGERVMVCPRVSVAFKTNRHAPPPSSLAHPTALVPHPSRTHPSPIQAPCFSTAPTASWWASSSCTSTRAPAPCSTSCDAD